MLNMEKWKYKKEKKKIKIALANILVGFFNILFAF